MASRILVDDGQAIVEDQLASAGYAGENGMTDYGQPQGKAYYAPSGAELQEIFTRVAADIMVHLVQ